MIKILCIEDEHDFREDVVEILRNEGYQTYEASSAQQGLEVISQENPDLILCDVHMPYMSGFDVIRTLRSNDGIGRHTPFIFLTAMGEKNDKITGISLQADDYIIKPVDFDILLATIHSKLKSKTSNGNNNYGIIAGKQINMSPFSLSKKIMSSLKDAVDISGNLCKEPYGRIGSRKYVRQIELLYGICTSLLSLVDIAMIKGIIVDKDQLNGEPVVFHEFINHVMSTMPSKEAKRIECEKDFISPVLSINSFYFSKALTGLLQEILANSDEKSPVTIKTARAKDGGVTIIISNSDINNSDFSAVNLLFTNAMAQLHGGVMEVTKNLHQIKCAITLPNIRVHHDQGHA